MRIGDISFQQRNHHTVFHGYQMSKNPVAPVVMFSVFKVLCFDEVLVWSVISQNVYEQTPASGVNSFYVAVGFTCT